MEQTLGRKLTRREVVHHINGCRWDNRPENLMIFGGNGAHIAYHYDRIRDQKQEQRAEYIMRLARIARGE